MTTLILCCPSMHVLADSYKIVLGSRYVPYALLLLPCLTVHGFVLLDNSQKIAVI